MFGIGLPELIVILAVGLIVVGPEKMPELARSLAKGIVELKKAAGALRDSLNEDDTVKDVNKVKDDITAAFQSLPPEAFSRDQDSPSEDRDVDLPHPPDDQHEEDEVIDMDMDVDVEAEAEAEDRPEEDKVIEPQAEDRPDTEENEKSA